MGSVKRLARGLMGRPRCKVWYGWGGYVSEICVHTDSDWAGDRATRKSVSGGVMRMGSYVVKHWSKDQGNVVKSSGEAELYAILRGTVEALGLAATAEELGFTFQQPPRVGLVAA